MPGRVEPSGLSHSPTLHPHPQLVRTKLSGKQRSVLTIPLTNLIAALAHRPMGTSFMEISTCTRCCDATRRRVQGWMGSKEVAYLRRLFTNGGLDHGGRADAGRSVALALQAAQEAARCGLPLSRPSGRESHFQAGNGSAAISGYYKNMGTMAPPSCAMVPPPEHARDARGSSTWVWHACECHHVSTCLCMICVARPRSDVHTSHRCMILWHSIC